MTIVWLMYDHIIHISILILKQLNDQIANSNKIQLIQSAIKKNFALIWFYVGTLMPFKHWFQILIVCLLNRTHLWHFQQTSSWILWGSTRPNHDWWCQHPLEGGSWTAKEARHVNFGLLNTNHHYISVPPRKSKNYFNKRILITKPC